MSVGSTMDEGRPEGGEGAGGPDEEAKDITRIFGGPCTTAIGLGPRTLPPLKGGSRYAPTYLGA
jgi:hypothetical protein